jgi:hypothetical protein
MKYPWAFGALHTALVVIEEKPEFHGNLPIATILFFPTTICRSRSAFGALGNPSNAPNICGCLLGIAFTIRSVQDSNNVPLWHVTAGL